MSAATDKLRDEIAEKLARNFEGIDSAWLDAEQDESVDDGVIEAVFDCENAAKKALDAYAAAIRAEERERAAGLVEALREAVAALALTTEECGHAGETGDLIQDEGDRVLALTIAALAAYEAERGEE